MTPKYIYDDPWEPPEHRRYVPPATPKQLDYLADLVERAGYIPAGYDPEDMTISEANAMIKKLREET